MIERILADYALAYGLHSISLRYFNAAGADPDGEIGEDHDPETHLIPLVLTAAREAEPITICGTDYDTPDGTCVRDFVHVTDLADAHVAALQALERGGGCNAYNLGTGKGFSVREVIRIAEVVTGKKIALKEGPRRAGDPPQLVADALRAEKELGWKAKFGELSQIVETAWDWLLTHRSEPAAYLISGAT